MSSGVNMALCYQERIVIVHSQCQLEQYVSGCHFFQGGEIEQHQASYASLGIAFTAYLLIVLFVLVVLFNSFSQPLLTLAILSFSIWLFFLLFPCRDYR